MKYPAIRLTLLFIVGIIAESQLDILSSQLLILNAALLISFLLLIKTESEKIKNILIVLLIISTGALSYSFKSEKKIKYPFNSAYIKNVVFEGIIKEKNLPDDKKQTITLNFQKVILNNSAHNIDFNSICYLKEYKKYKHIRVGNYVRVEGNLFRLKNKRNPGEFDFEKYMSELGIASGFSISKLKILAERESLADLFYNIIYDIRQHIDESSGKYLSRESLGFVRGFILADKSLIDSETKETFINTGVVHILAVSGFNVGIIALFLAFVSARTGYYLKNIIMIAGIIFFLLITLWPASVLRASLMFIIFIIAGMLNRSSNKYNILAISAFIILLLNPAQLFDPGFQLSYTAVLSMLIFYPYFERKILDRVNNKILKFAAGTLLVSLAATIGTLPLTIFYFKKLSLISLAANLFIVPYVAVVTYAMLIFLIISLTGLPFLSYFSVIIELMIKVLTGGTAIFESVPYSSVNINYFPFIQILILLVTILFVSYYIYKSNNYYFKITTVVLATLIFFLQHSLLSQQLLNDNKLNILAVDVGQGDCFIIKFDDGKTAIIDAGAKLKNYDNGEKVIYPLLRRNGIEKLDYAFISHMDNDHYGGMKYLINKGMISEIRKPVADSASTNDLLFEDYCIKNGIKIKHFNNEIIKLSNARMWVIKPEIKKTKKNINNSSGIIKLVYGNSSFLFTGDADESVEKNIIQLYGSALKSNVLKVSHHGSHTATSSVFLDYIKPQRSLISAGQNNRFKHPSDKVINLLNERKIKTDRTDYEGAVLYVSDGKSINKINWRELE